MRRITFGLSLLAVLTLCLAGFGGLTLSADAAGIQTGAELQQSIDQQLEALFGAKTQSIPDCGSGFYCPDEDDCNNSCGGPAFYMRATGCCYCI